MHVFPQLRCQRALEEQMRFGLDSVAPRTNAVANARVGRLQKPEPRLAMKRRFRTALEESCLPVKCDIGMRIMYFYR